jgi:hypothetical protein
MVIIRRTDPLVELSNLELPNILRDNMATGKLFKNENE